MEELNPLRPMEFGEILGTGWRLTRRTLSTAGVLLLVITIGLSLLMLPFLREFIRAISDIILDPAMQVEKPDSDVVMRHIMPMIGSIIAFAIVGFLSFFLVLFAQTAATFASWDAINEQETSIGSLIRRTFRRPYWYVLAQALIIYGILMIANLAVSILGALLGAFTMGIGYILVQFVYQVALIYLAVATIFKLHQIVIAERGPWQALVTSFNLVKENWWRTFGVMFVLGLILGVIIIPLMLPMVIPMIREFVAIIPEQRGAEPSPALVATAFANIANSISPVWILLMAVAGSIMTLMGVNTLTAMYVDLRARRGDFHADDDDLQVTMVS